MCLCSMFLSRSEHTLFSLLYHTRYDSFLDAVCKVPFQCETDPLRLFPGARALLDEFQEVAADKAAACMNADMDVESFSPEDALDYILGAAIERFGHSAQDVFDAVFDYTQSTRVHQAAFGLTLTQLEDTISFMADNQATPKLSHRIFALSPVYSNPYTDDDWTVNFQSDWVARSIIQHFDVAERNLIC
jgi:hypothetical protein